jgi:hypothetical protein
MDVAFDYLERALTERDVGMLSIHQESEIFESPVSHVRFESLLRRRDSALATRPRSPDCERAC